MSVIPYKPDIDLSNVMNRTVLEVYRKKFRVEKKYDVYKGGAGSGKSRFIAQKILYRVIYQNNHRYLIIRKVKDTLKASVFQLLKDYIYSWGVESKFHITESPMKITHKHSGNTIIFMGVDNSEKLKSIEKITSIWIEEASELDEKDFNELDRRLRGNLPNYKQIHISFNPISHLHWLKSRFFDNPPQNLDIIETTFLDNPMLPEEDREVLRDMERYDYQQYRIYALNEWGVLNQNIIHHRYDFKKHGSDKTLNDFQVLHIGIDFNISGCVGVVLGEDNQGIAHIIDEFVVYDTEDIIIELQNRYSDKEITLYPDASGANRSTSSRQTDVDMLIQAGFYCNVPEANGAVATRYNACNRKFIENTLLVNPYTAPRTNESLQTHAYNERGEPEKFTDHSGGAIDDYTDACFSGDTLVNVNHKTMKFKDIPESGVIMGYDGKYKEYVNGGVVRYDNLCDIKLGDGTIIKATPDHKFLTLDGWVEAKYLKGKVLCNTQLYQKMYSSLEDGNITKGQTTISIKRLERTIKQLKGNQDNLFIEKLGNFITVQYLTAMLFIIKTKTKLITIFQTLNSWRVQNIENTTVKNGILTTLFNLKRIWIFVKTKLKNGTAQIKAKNGTKSILKTWDIFSILKNFSLVPYAKKNMKELSTQEQEIYTAQTNAVQRREEIAELITNKENVWSVEQNLLLANILQQQAVQEVVGLSTELEKKPTYCVTVPSDGCFALDNGLIVSNCGYIVVRLYPIVAPISTHKIKGF